MSRGRGAGVRFDPEDERLARAAWSALAEPGDREAQRLLAERGPVGGLRRVLAGGGPPRWRVRLPELDPVRDIGTVRRFGGRLLQLGDEEWPPGLAALGPEAPPCLWVRGPLHLAEVAAQAAALVGARASTDYGNQVAADLAAGCGDRGITVVSGAAYGIDGSAHRGALAVGGPTVAVLACGVDRAYPRGHESLIGRIAAEGLVVAEVPPGCAPTRWRFVERNRLIAALARVTVVVEAAHRSGALGTARRAARLGLPVAAVPGPVTSPMSYGCHRLLREEAAICVTTPDEVAELAGPIGTFLPEEADVPRRPIDDLEGDERRVVEALPIRRAAAFESVARAAGLDEEGVVAALGRLEARGLAVREGAGWRRSGDL